MVKLERAWFSQSPRNDLRDFLDEQARLTAVNMHNFHNYNGEDGEIAYALSSIGATLTGLQTVRYLAVDPDTTKTWITRQRVSHPLEVAAFTNYCDTIVMWLISQQPPKHLAALVHIQELLRFFTTMEIK